MLGPKSSETEAAVVTTAIIQQPPQSLHGRILGHSLQKGHRKLFIHLFTENTSESYCANFISMLGHIYESYMSVTLSLIVINNSLNTHQVPRSLSSWS